MGIGDGDEQRGRLGAAGAGARDGAGDGGAGRYATGAVAGIAPTCWASRVAVTTCYTPYILTLFQFVKTVNLGTNRIVL